MMTFHSDISVRYIDNAVNDLFSRTNNLADFSNPNSSTFSVLHKSYFIMVFGF